MSAIQVFIDDQMALVGHLVGSDTIGYEEELGLNTQSSLAEPWRAMLLKDEKGDVGIVLARWLGFRPGKPGVAGTKGIPGSNMVKKGAFFVSVLRFLTFTHFFMICQCFRFAFSRFIYVLSSKNAFLKILNPKIMLTKILSNF